AYSVAESKHSDKEDSTRGGAKLTSAKRERAAHGVTARGSGTSLRRPKSQRERRASGTSLADRDAQALRRDRAEDRRRARLADLDPQTLGVRRRADQRRIVRDRDRAEARAVA